MSTQKPTGEWVLEWLYRVLAGFIVVLEWFYGVLVGFIGSYFLSGLTVFFTFCWLDFPLKKTKTKKFKRFLLGKLTK